jgi:large subunit ribosomal protein L18
MLKKELLRAKRHRRIRMRITGSTDCPRLVIRRGLKNFSCQLIDDSRTAAVLSLSTSNKEVKAKLGAGAGGNIKAAQSLGEALAAKIKEKGISKVVFDRAGYLYHGRVKAFVEALRKGGVQL